MSSPFGALPSAGAHIFGAPRPLVRSMPPWCAPSHLVRSRLVRSATTEGAAGADEDHRQHLQRGLRGMENVLFLINSHCILLIMLYSEFNLYEVY